MILSIIISSITCISLILFVIFKPTIKINKLKLDTFWLVAIAGATLTLLTGALPFDYLAANLEASTSINPLKINKNGKDTLNPSLIGSQKVFITYVLP